MILNIEYQAMVAFLGLMAGLGSLYIAVLLNYLPASNLTYKRCLVAATALAFASLGCFVVADTLVPDGAFMEISVLLR